MHPRRSLSPADTRQRLLAAAAQVYGRAGLTGATTRAIADEAGLNEVTLFRHFQTKERLLAAVVGQNFGAPPARPPAAPLAPTADLHADLLLLARRYEALLAENLPLVRAMLGEIQHHGRKHEKNVFRAVFRPLKEAIVARLATARAQGQLRAELSADLLADLLGGMLFTGLLRRSMCDGKADYSASAHLEAAIALVVRGASSKGRPA